MESYTMVMVLILIIMAVLGGMVVLLYRKSQQMSDMLYLLSCKMDKEKEARIEDGLASISIQKQQSKVFDEFVKDLQEALSSMHETLVDFRSSSKFDTQTMFTKVNQIAAAVGHYYTLLEAIQDSIDKIPHVDLDKIPEGKEVRITLGDGQLELARNGWRCQNCSTEKEELMGKFFKELD